MAITVEMLLRLVFTDDINSVKVGQACILYR